MCRPGASTVLGAGPRVVAKACERVDRSALDGEEHGVVLELGELSRQRLPVPRA
jgi:hypothetical protein